MRIRGVKHVAASLYTGYQAVVEVAYTGLLHGAIQEGRVLVHTDLTQRHLLIRMRFLIGYYLLHSLAEARQIFVGS